jgi:hypothetical protein
VSAAENLTAAWRNVTAEDIETGSVLYHEYRARIARIAEEYRKPVAAACGAFAALSPASPIVSNFRSLVTCMIADQRGLEPGQFRVATYDRGKIAALKILSGEADFSDVCQGPKITAFRHNLLFPATSPHVTIDGHMIGIMTGKLDLKMREALFHEREGKGGGDLARYRDAERAFLRWWRKSRDASKLPPCAVQAILWHAKRREAKGEFDLGHGLPDVFKPFDLAAGTP